MPENKTKVTEESVDAHLAAITDAARREDCRILVRLMSAITHSEPRMWGASIVGFDSYHYKYESGHEGDMAATGFASRKGDLTVYLAASGANQEELLARLGRHKMGKSCLYIKKLADVDIAVLEQLIVDSVAEVKRLLG